MIKSIINVCLFVFVLSISSSSFALDFIKLGTGHDVGDFWGTPDAYLAPFPSTIQYLQAKGKNQTNPIDTLTVTDENVQDVFAGVYGPFDALVFSERLEKLTPETYGLINNYVSNGGCLILTGSHLAEADFLNNTFGFSVSVIGVNNGVDTFSIQPGAAAGTQFAGGPSGLIAADATVAFSNTPGIDIYTGSTGVAVFTDTFGLGTLTAIGWDYCCTPPDNQSDILDWYEVVNRAFDQCFPSSQARPIPTLSEWGLIAMAGILGLFGLLVVRRRLTA